MADPFEDIRAFIRAQLIQRSLPSLAVAVVRDGAIVWAEGFGWADREARRLADEHTLYSIAWLDLTEEQYETLRQFDC